LPLATPGILEVSLLRSARRCGHRLHDYQYLFKTNRPDIPFATYNDELIDAAIDQRRQFFESKRDRLYEIEIYYVIVLEGARSKTGILSALARMLRDPQGGFGELKAQFTSDNMKTLLRSHIDADLVRLEQRVQNFTRQLADLMPIEIQGQQAQFRFFRRLLNFDEWRIAGRPQSTQYLDYQVVNSNIEAERDHRHLEDGLGYLKVAMFPGLVGVEVANEISHAVEGLGKIDSLIIDLRGNTGGGIGALRIMSLLTPDRIPVGFALDRQCATPNLDSEKQRFRRFHAIPASKKALWMLALKFAPAMLAKTPIVLETEGLGRKDFHGRVILLVDRHTASTM
jgi:hypothetical protein